MPDPQNTAALRVSPFGVNTSPLETTLRSLHSTLRRPAANLSSPSTRILQLGLSPTNLLQHMLSPLIFEVFGPVRCTGGSEQKGRLGMPQRAGAKRQAVEISIRRDILNPCFLFIVDVAAPFRNLFLQAPFSR